MKLVTIEINKEEKAAALVNEEYVIDLQEAGKAYNVDYRFPRTMLEAIDDGENFLAEAEKIAASAHNHLDASYVYPLSSMEITLKAPIPVPRKNIICAGKNYADHAMEMGSAADIPDHPIIFTKSPTTVIGPEEPIDPHTDVTDALDYEGEIAVIIGKTGKGIKAEEAEDYIFGCTLLNDVTARDLQTRHKQFFLGKSLDTFCPMGPAIVPVKHWKGKTMSLKTLVNDEIRQETTTDKMIFSISQLIEVISRGMTLEPGDIIATGTPAGVGKGFNPPKYLNDGDEVVVQSVGIGQLKNTVNKK
ncbi:fumarylacetoacetate hydrolase family protein [Alteribacillus bidgolensis]|uniref:2-keto-4-pentenoate hydratase/2-oxohepta-3-ene-1,7-dioic acid hydratase (Catechol pathway) n=1 Tax=Alteribacillus bidgolensis TaxID=930129 RepID=A0A1G8MDU5_9BACI|nr:fumarylacetoacetate hydrolase family protein [Alteribacillus bidgolensis]SDI66091.1 2-keto-4-pentenoate hydratase/2-oxohepta-3-ene-1,7-dioic acid hydratase (catechol pathway) [Alteribacillus bidgolensis]